MRQVHVAVELAI